MTSWSEKILDFYQDLQQHPKETDFEVLYPYSDKQVQSVMAAFYEKFYQGQDKRTMILGINPGRFGAGVTAIPFTDPLRLRDECGITHALQGGRELSSVFVYELIEQMGGVKAFYGQFYISSVSPLGYVRDGKNLNYYDDQALFESWKPWIVRQMWRQLDWPVRRDKVILWGKGKNYKYFKALNEEEGFFDEIVVLPHPRWVMQYRLKEKAKWLDNFVAEMKE
ncbi:MAG TPA: uracil-DNA glycosylase family protein [Saprospiraceae bacterium]|nr:uracil-DNA glycosylase family protein [Saprospiraceae bacterium]